MRPNILRSFGWLKPGFIAFNKDLVGFFTPLLVGNRLCLRGWRFLACIVWWLNHRVWFYKMAMPGKCSSLSSVCYWDWSNFIHPWWSKFIQYFWLISSSNPVWSTLAILDSSTESNKSASFDRGWCWFVLDEFGDSVSNPFDGLSVNFDQSLSIGWRWASWIKIGSNAGCPSVIVYVWCLQRFWL